MAVVIKSYEYESSAEATNLVPTVASLPARQESESNILLKFFTEGAPSTFFGALLNRCFFWNKARIAFY